MRLRHGNNFARLLFLILGAAWKPHFKFQNDPRNNESNRHALSVGTKTAKQSLPPPRTIMEELRSPSFVFSPLGIIYIYLRNFQTPTSKKGVISDNTVQPIQSVTCLFHLYYYYYHPHFFDRRSVPPCFHHTPPIESIDSFVITYGIHNPLSLSFLRKQKPQTNV